MRPRQRISCFPTGRLSALVRADAPFKPHLARFTSLFPLARTALYWGVISLRLPSGSVAWAPSFHCGVEVQAMHEAGCDVRFYRVNNDLTIDEGDLISKAENHPGLVLLIHYFGFPQPATACHASLSRTIAW